MLETRKVLTALIGYILGIIMGLYCKISIVPFYIFILLIYLISKGEHKKSEFKLFSIKRYLRYVKIILTPKVIKSIVIFSIISNSIVLMCNNKYDKLYKNLDLKKCEFEGIVTQVFNDKVKVKILNSQYKNTYLNVYYKNKKIEYGDKIKFNGIFKLPQKQSNYKGFDYSKYLKTNKIYGTLNAKQIEVISKDNGNQIIKFTNKFADFIKNKINNSKLENEEKNLFIGILLGDKENLSIETKENFQESNLSHILAVSGMHVTYIILFMTTILGKTIGKYYSKIITSLIIIIYICMVNFTPSVMRAGITGIIAICANIFYRKNDLYESLAISLMIILILNPYNITNIGLKLSFLATIGIIEFEKTFENYYENWKDRINRRAIRRNKKITKFCLKIFDTKIIKSIIKSIFLALSVSVLVMPIIAINFKNIAFFSLFIGIIASFLIGPIIIVGIIFLFIDVKFLSIILNNLLKLLISLSKIGSKMPLNNIYIIPPNIITIIFYYFFIFILNSILKIKLKKNPSMFQKRVINLVNVFKHKIRIKKSKIINIILVITIISLFYKYIPKELVVNFIDVGQGDSTLITTPEGKKILIDGGGSENSSYNIGKSVLMPYLLNRKVTSIDYVIFSHFDSDHAQGLLYIMKNMKVKNAIIGKQYESSENFENFIGIAKERKINVKVVEAGNRINIEDKVYFNVLWPSSSNMISENAINNNSLVCKLKYKNFSMLFTGDIEETAENEILKFYKSNLEVLEANGLKVAHHGSKTSSIINFLNAVRPKFAVIGVGKNNNFGHPSGIILERLESINCVCYRTDERGEIEIKTNGNSMKHIKYHNHTIF